jgi:predicted dehydrogenase
MPVPRPVSRRRFLGAASSVTAALAFPALLRSGPGGSPGQRLNVACVGVGGRGWAAVQGVSSQNLVAFADVDDVRAARTFREHPDVPRFRDYRVMLERLGKEIDAITVSTPDHMHYPIARAALELGKHVFVEKPLGHTVWEARELSRLASEKRVATQMGNQGHAAEGMRLLREWYQAGILGEIREIHSWTDRPIWPQGLKGFDHSQRIPVVPETLDWDRWLGVAAARRYDPGYLPFNWRGFWDFGTGALGDMGCHQMDGAFWAFDLGAPAWVEPVSANATELSAPTSSIVRYGFPARGARPAVQWTWYDGNLGPPLPPELEEGRTLPENSTLIVGTRASVIAQANYFTVRIVPEVRMRELAPTLPPKTIPRIPGGDHFAEWINACKGGPAAGSHFGYSGPLTEMVLLGNVALRARRRIEWDSAAFRITNLPAANALLTKVYRPGWGV